MPFHAPELCVYIFLKKKPKSTLFNKQSSFIIYSHSENKNGALNFAIALCRVVVLDLFASIFV